MPPTLESQTPNPERGSKDTASLAIVALFYRLLKLGMQLEIDSQSQKNLADLNQALLQTSAILFIYHAQTTDALVLPIALRSELENLDKLLGPVAITHYQGWQKIYLDLIGQLTGSIPLPVIRKKDEANFTEAEKSQHLKKLIATTNQYLDQPGSIYGVAPMGTRAKTLDSRLVNPGFAKLAQSKSLPTIPMAVTHQHGKTQIVAGELQPAPEPQEALEDVVTRLMGQLALILPSELRGDYS